jgi:hypothetical protein
MSPPGNSRIDVRLSAAEIRVIVKVLRAWSNSEGCLLDRNETLALANAQRILAIQDATAPRPTSVLQRGARL